VDAKRLAEIQHTIDASNALRTTLDRERREREQRLRFALTSGLPRVLRPPVPGSTATQTSDLPRQRAN
jgi:hypothetical protein